MKFKILGAILMVFSLNSIANNVNSVGTTITKLYTYGEERGNISNDIVIKVSSSTPGCKNGFWVKSSDNIANKNIAAFLLSAFHANSKVYFSADNDQLWSGSSSGIYCKVSTIILAK
jgi:hypothetical protein